MRKSWGLVAAPPLCSDHGPGTVSICATNGVYVNGDEVQAGLAAAQAEAAAAEGAAKAKEEALAKAREAACSHECTHLKGTR